MENLIFRGVAWRRIHITSIDSKCRLRWYNFGINHYYERGWTHRILPWQQHYLEGLLIGTGSLEKLRRNMQKMEE
jgi:hypothetical protein